MCTLSFGSAHSQCLSSQAAPGFQSTAGVLKSYASACAVARTRRSLAHEKLEREKDLENCAAVLEGGVGWPRPGSGRGKPPLVDEDLACSVDSIFPWRCHTALRQAASTEKLTACVRLLVLRRSVFVERTVFACTAVFACALLSRRSSRPVLHTLHIRGTAAIRSCPDRSTVYIRNHTNVTLH